MNWPTRLDKTTTPEPGMSAGTGLLIVIALFLVPIIWFAVAPEVLKPQAAREATTAVTTPQPPSFKVGGTLMWSATSRKIMPIDSDEWCRPEPGDYLRIIEIRPDSLLVEAGHITNDPKWCQAGTKFWLWIPGLRPEEAPNGG